MAGISPFSSRHGLLYGWKRAKAGFEPERSTRPGAGVPPSPPTTHSQRSIWNDPAILGNNWMSKHPFCSDLGADLIQMTYLRDDAIFDDRWVPQCSLSSVIRKHSRPSLASQCAANRQVAEIDTIFTILRVNLETVRRHRHIPVCPPWRYRVRKNSCPAGPGHASPARKDRPCLNGAGCAE
jgi:hypothetical protein